jgi:uncharacterized protein
MDIYRNLTECTGFQWDEGNIKKNWISHGVTFLECEQIFFNLPMVCFEDQKHSQEENRYYALGKTDADRFLFIVFTVREKRIRIISARDMNKKERQVYIKHEKDS